MTKLRTLLPNLRKDLISVLKIIAVMLPMTAMIACVMLEKYFGVDISELYFLSTTIGLSLLSLLYLSNTKGNILNTIMKTSTVFWGSTSVVYVISWVFFNDPHSLIVWCFGGGVIIGICSVKWLKHKEL